MTSESPLNLLRGAYAAARSGRRDEAAGLADRFSAAAAAEIAGSAGRKGEYATSSRLAALLDPAHPNESALFAIGPLQNLYTAMEEWELAALKGEDVCALAELLAPNTRATAGDYTMLADALERRGEPERALQATETAIRHMKESGEWAEFAGIYEQRIEHLRRLCGLLDEDSAESDRAFWGDVRSICVRHLQKMIRHFESHGAAHMDFARPRYEQLIEDEVIDQVIAAARRLLHENPEGVVLPVPVASRGDWRIVLSVLPTSDDALVIASCPDLSFENLARLARAEFRKLPDWKALDFAHWILALDQPDSATAHLHTHWSLFSHVRWIEAAGGAKTVKMPPSIVAESLLRTPTGALRMELFQEDVDLWVKEDEEK
jgi:hypothetical protein